MTGVQYECFCRFFIADQLHLSLEEVCSGRVASPVYSGIHEFNHQIDLYWQTGDLLTRQLNIANVKWHDTRAVRLMDVLLLREVQRSVGAHKAVLITNTLFSRQAEWAAEQAGIGLLIVRPAFGYDGLPRESPAAIQAQLQERARGPEPLYTYTPINKGLDTISSDSLLRLMHRRSFVRAVP